MPSITVKAEIARDGDAWLVRTYLQDKLLTTHGPIPTEEMANDVALEQIKIARQSLAKDVRSLRQHTATKI